MKHQHTETFNAVDEAGRVHEVEVWAEVTYMAIDAQIGRDAMK